MHPSRRAAPVYNSNWWKTYWLRLMMVSQQWRWLSEVNKEDLSIFNMKPVLKLKQAPSYRPQSFNQVVNSFSLRNRINFNELFTIINSPCYFILKLMENWMVKISSVPISEDLLKIFFMPRSGSQTSVGKQITYREVSVTTLFWDNVTSCTS